MLVSDIWSAAKGSSGYGTCDDTKLYESITEGVELLANHEEWDWMIGYMTLCAFDGYVTLPREVEKVLAANVNGHPTWARDKWYVHHINGTGEYSQIDGYQAFHDEVGVFPTFRSVPEPSLLIGVPELASDEGKQMIVYGYDWTDKELYHINDQGLQVRGIRIPITQQSVPNYLDPTVVKSITAVEKPVTNGMVVLWGFPQCFDEDKEPTILGQYYPDETYPQYRRYRFPKASCINMKYRRKNIVYKTQNDHIPFDNRTALLMILKAIRKLHDGDVANAQLYENKAVEILRKSESAKKAKNTIGPQVRNFSSNNNERLRGYYRGGRGRCC